MVKIRLRLVGAKKQPSYRVIVADSRAPRDGRFIENIGFYNPRTEPETVRIEEERALYWLNVGAQTTAAAARLLKKMGTMARFERLKQGEPLETLVAEAEETAQAASEISPKTRREYVAPSEDEPAVESETDEPEEEASAEEEERMEPAEAEDESEEEQEEEEEEKETTEPAEAENESEERKEEVDEVAAEK